MEPPSFPAGGPQILRATPGSDAGLVLPLPSGSPPFQFEWSRAGAKLSERFTSSHNAGGVRLSITAARTGDSGVYTLQASNAAGKDTTRVRLEVSPDEMPTGDDPPTFLRRLQDLTVKVGTRTRFLVEIVSSTECRVTWYRNERRLMEAERIALVRDGNFWCADISAVSVDDAGRWTCTAENIGGRASCSAHLNVLVPKAYKRPEFVEELRALLTEQGTVSLECKVVGVPTPVLRWFKDSREIKAGDVFALTANAEDPTSLGTYTCEAVNCMGRAYSSSKVQVVGRASREGSTRPSSGGVMLDPPPIFTKELEDQFVRICERLTLSCQIVVPPWPRSVVWYNKEGKVESNDKYHILEDGVGGYFIEIQTSEFPDEGEWKCVATSAGGRVGISTCYVSMDIPKNYRKPRFMENLQAVLTDEGLVSFECKVVGFPTPVLSWFKDGQELKPGDVYQLTGTNSLGSYCCIARNFMGQASSSAELTVEDIQNQLNEEEKLQLFSKNQAPKYLQGLKSVEAKIDEPFRFTIKVAIPPEPTVLWYRDEQPVDESSRCHLGNEERGSFFLDIQNLEFMDQAEWKCVAMNDYGQSVTSCFLKLVIPRHYKKPRFLENLQAILSDEGAVNLECKVIGVPQPVLKWYKDGEELKPGDIHRIISGQDGTCCLGTYTCEAQNCMGIAASSASLLGFEDSLKAKNKKKTDEQTLQRNLSLSTIHEERTSQMYDTPVGDITLDDKGEISFSFDGKEVSVSLYETPDLTEEEALQIVEMYADQLSENVTEHNVVELPPLRFVKETSTSGNLLMEAIIIDVSPEYFTSPEEDLRTEADIEDISIADENGPPQLSLDQDVSGEDYLEKTMALLSEERADISKKMERKKSDSQKSVDDYFSLSRDRSSSEEKKDDETQGLSESDLQSFASAHSAEKLKSKSSKPSLEDGQESSDITKTVLLKEDLKAQFPEKFKSQKERRGSRGSRRSTSSEKSPLLMQEDILEKETNKEKPNKILAENIKIEMVSISSSLTKVMNAIQIIERDIILKSELMSVAATASRSLEIINSLITPLSEIHSITDTITETENESSEIICSLFNRLPQSLRMLEQSLTIVEKCIDYESDNKTLVKKTCVSLIEKCGNTLNELITKINTVAYKDYTFISDICISNIISSSENILKTLKRSEDASKKDKILNETIEDTTADISLESKHLHHTQKVLYSLKSSLKSVLSIIGGEDVILENIEDLKNAEIILDEISTPIQELQNALEQIEILSMAESNSNLPKFNTEIIDSIMNNVLKLRTAFEKLSTDKENNVNEVLLDIIQNIQSMSSQLDVFEEKNGKFDILHNDNKLEVLQTMAQILISLENSLPILDTIPNLKENMSDFHKNLTKVLENVIEGNDSTKYFSFMEICSAVSRIKTSLNNLESRQMISLAIINNTLKIIQRSVQKTVFENTLHKSVLNSINKLLLDIQETKNQVEESTLNVDSEKVEDLSLKEYEKNKLISVLEHVQKTIATMSKEVSFENVENLHVQETIAQVFENIHPILTEIQCCVASFNVNTKENFENVSDITLSSFTEAIAHPLCELHQNISVLNEVICENVKHHEITQFTTFAKPLIELQTTLEILQTEVISQYEEIIQCPEILCTIANSVDNLQSCIVKIQEHDVLEVADDMSTLDDISGIKTTADILLPTNQYDKMSSVDILKIEEHPVIHTDASQALSVQALQAIKKNILSLQNSDIAENVKALPDNNDTLPMKSLILELEVIHSSIQSTSQPIIMEEPQKLSLNAFKLISLVQPLKHLQESLSVVSATNIEFFENVEKVKETQVFTENLLTLKADVDKILNILEFAVEAVDGAIDEATKRVALKELPEKLDILLNEYVDENLKTELANLSADVLNIKLSDNIDNEEVKDIIEKVNKNISKIQDDGFKCTAQNLDILSHESKFVKTLCDIEQSIATLEKCDFPEESLILTSETDNEPTQNTIDTEFDPLTNLEQITMIILNTMYNESNESSENDIKLTEVFVDTIRKEISLLRYLIAHNPSPKQIIKSIQVFYALLRNINDYKSKYNNTLSDEFNICLKASLYDMEGCLKNIKAILIQIIHSESQLLFDIPQTKINDGKQFLKNILQSENDISFHTTYSVILRAIELSKPFCDNLENKMIEELSTSEYKISPQDKADLNDNYDSLASFLSNQAKNSLENPVKQLTEKLLHVIRKHDDVKNIIGVGKNIIFMQCILDSIDLLKQCSEESKLIESIERSVPKEMNIDELLLEISKPLDCFNMNIINIRNKIILASEKNIGMTELKTLETHINSIIKLNEVINCISNEELFSKNHDVALAGDLINKIHVIINNLKTLENTPIFETIKVVVKPIEEIEKNLNLIITQNRNLIDKKSLNNKEKAEALLQQMEQHIEIIEIVEEVSAVIRLDDLKETASLVRELRGSIAGSESAIESGVEECNSIISDQIPLTHKLQKALLSLHSQALDCAKKDTIQVKEDIRQQIIEVVSDLQNNLIQLTNISLENQPENLNNVQTDTVQEDDNLTILIHSDKHITDDFDEKSSDLPEINDENLNRVPETKQLQESDVKNLHVEGNTENNYNLLTCITSEDVYASKPLIVILLGNIQEYLVPDITNIAKEFASYFNYEAVRITQDISQQLCQDSNLNNYVSNETTDSMLMSNEQVKLLSNLQNNLESILTLKPAKETEEVVVEDKLLRFQNVAKNLYDSIQNLNILPNTTKKDAETEKLAIDSPLVVEPELEEFDGSPRENQILLRQNDSEPKDIVVSKNVTEYTTSNRDENAKEDLEATKENLVHYISEYLNEEVTEILKQTLPIINIEEIEKSSQIANQLFILCNVPSFDETSNCNHLKEKLELTIQLKEAITTIQNQIFNEIQNLPSFLEVDKLQKIQPVLNNLSDSLQKHISSERNVEIEQVKELDICDQGIHVELVQSTVKVDETEDNADLVCATEEPRVLLVDKNDDEMLDLKKDENILLDKSDQSSMKNEVLEGENLMMSTDPENDDSIQKLEKLLQEVNDDIDLFLTNADNSEIIQNNLDEVQSVIIKLKCDFDGNTNDALKETLEDLECNVRSVQLQINEQGPPVLLKEECSNLQAIVVCLKNVEDVKKTNLVSNTDIVKNNCSEEADKTIQLLNNACCIESNSKLDNIISCLNNVKDIMKFLRTSFLGDTETLILKGVDVIQNLDQVEDTIFSLEKDVDKLKDTDDNVKDNIVTAIHSVYGSISNMRGTISSIQKRYMYEKYGKPSQNFLKSIKNISDISQLNDDNKSSWKNCAKFLRKVLNHFEDIKFYINFDRTARIPNDAAFTKIILQETIAVLNDVQKLHDINSHVKMTINNLSNYVNSKNVEIEEKATLEVKEKIPIFIDLSVKILEATEVIKLQLQRSAEDESVSKFIQTDDKKQTNSTNQYTEIGESEEVQPTIDLNKESDEFSLKEDKENEDLVKATTEHENVSEDTSILKNIAEVLNLPYSEDNQTNENEQLGADKEQVKKEKMSKEVDNSEISSENTKQSDYYLETEKVVELDENKGPTILECQCVQDKNYESEKTQLSTSKDFLNVITSDNDTTEEHNIVTREENKDNQQVIKNAEIENTLKIQEPCNSTYNEKVNENQQLDNLKDIFEANTSGELSEKVTSHITVIKNMPLNEHKAKVNILDNKIQVGLLADDSSDNNSESSMIDNHNYQATDNIDHNLNIQEKDTLSEKQPVDHIEIENSEICKQSHQNPILKNEEIDTSSRMFKDDTGTNERNECSSLSEVLKIGKKDSGVIIDSKIIFEDDDGRKVEVQDSTAYKEEMRREESLPDKEKNSQETNNNITHLNMGKEEVPLNTNSECVLTPINLQTLTLPDKEKVTIIKDNEVTDSLSPDILNTETSSEYFITDTEKSTIHIEEELKKDNKSYDIDEPVISKELSVGSDTLNEEKSLQKECSIFIKDSQNSISINTNNLNLLDENLKKVTENIKYEIGKEEDSNRSEKMINDDSRLSQGNPNTPKTEQVILPLTTEKIETNVDMEKSSEPQKEFIQIPALREPLLNVKADLDNKEIKDNFDAHDHEKPIVNKNSENNINIKEMNIKEIPKQEQNDKIDSDFIANSKVEEFKENLNSEYKATVAETSGKGNQKDDQETININKDVPNEDIERSILEEKQKETSKCHQSESGNQIILSNVIEKNTQSSYINVESEIDNNKLTESMTETKDMKKIKAENKEAINAKSHIDTEKAPVKKNEEDKSVNILGNIHHIKEQEQSDINEANLTADTRLKKNSPEFEHKAMGTEIYEDYNKKDQKTTFSQKDFINKDDELLKCNKRQEETVEWDQSESDDQIIYTQSIEKGIQEPYVKVQDKEDKQATKSKSENKDDNNHNQGFNETVDANSPEGGRNAPKIINEKNESVNLFEGTDVPIKEEKEEFDNKETNLPSVALLKNEYLDSSQITTMTEILELDNKKDYQTALTLNEIDISKNDEQSILKEKREEALKLHQPESDDEMIFSKSIEKDIQKADEIVKFGQETKKITEGKLENVDVTDGNFHKDGTQAPVERIGELLNILEGTGIYEIQENAQSQYIEKNLSADKSEKKEFSEFDHQNMVTEILEKDNEKFDLKSVTLKNDVIIQDTEHTIIEEKNEESAQCKETEAELQIMANKSKENDSQAPDAKAQPSPKIIEATESKSYSIDENTIEQKHIGEELVNIIKVTDIDQTRNQKQLEKSGINVIGQIVEEKYLDTELKDIETKIVEISKGKDHQESTLLKDMIDENLISKKTTPEKSVDYVKSDSDPQEILEELMKKGKDVPHETLQSELDNKETKESKFYIGDQDTRVNENEEYDLPNNSKSSDIHQIKEQEHYDKNLENPNIYTIAKAEHSESPQESVTAKILENDAKKEQDSIIPNENKKLNEKSDSLVAISEKKLEYSTESNNFKPDNQAVDNKTQSQEEMKLDKSVQSDLDNKKKVNVEIKDQKEQSIKSKEDSEKTFKSKESMEIINIDLSSELSNEPCKLDYQENIILNKDVTGKDQDIVTDQESLVNNCSGAERKEIDEIGNAHIKQLIELDKSDTNKTNDNIDKLAEKKNLESGIKPLETEIDFPFIVTQEKYEKDRDTLEIRELKNEIKNQSDTELLYENNKKDNIYKSEEDFTFICEKNEQDIDITDVFSKNNVVQGISTIENNLQTLTESNITVEGKELKGLEKTKNEDNADKEKNKSNIKQTEKNKKTGKKKVKPDKKKTIEEQKENIEEKSNIRDYTLIEEKDILVKEEDNNPPIQPSVSDEQGIVIDTGNKSVSMEEYIYTEHKEISSEDKTRARYRSDNNKTKTKEHITNAGLTTEREHLICEKSPDNFVNIESEKEKSRPKESVIFIDHNKIDYTLQFPRPPNYASKSFDNEELVCSDLNSLNRAPIYKAQTLMNDYQTRSSYSPHIDHIDQSSHGYGERSIARSKAVSESRSITSEKRSTRDIKRKPVFSTFLTDRTAVESSRVKLTCSILSSSDPTITWYKNGSLLEDKQKFRSKFIDGLITLEVLNAIPNDSGEYSCTIGNEYGTITSSANLKVYPSFEASPIPPTFTRSIRDVYHSLENELVLECRIRGQPLPSITWYKDDKPITLCERYQAHYLADGVCRLTVSSPTKEDSGKYTCHAESSIWSDQIYHNVQFNDKESCVSPNIITLEKVRLNRQVLESRKPHFTNVISDCKVVSGGTIGLQVEIKGSPTRVEWLREGCSVTDTYRNAQTYVDHGIYTLALTDVTEKESGLYTCRAWSSHGNVDMNASIIVVQPNQINGKPAVIVSRPPKDVHISIGEDINISFRVQGEPKAKVILMKGLRDITHSQRVCKMTSDDYIKFTLKRSVISDAGTYCILARNAYGCDRAFVTVVIRQRATSENLVSDWTYPMDDLAISTLGRNYKAVPDRIPSEPSVVDGGKNWVSLAWPKPDCQTRAPILAYKVESWLIGKEGGARWAELGITPRNSFDAFNLKQEEEYHFRVTPRNRYGWGESVQTTSPIGIGLTGDRPEFIDILPGQLKVLLGETATLCCTFKGKPTPEILWLKNGHDIEEDSTRIKITLNSFKACLNIENVKIEDEGRYSCEASNVHGRSSTYARMTVITDRSIWEADAKLKRERSSGVEGEYPPQFTMRLRDRRVQATYPVRLTCQVIGSPAPVLTWFKNGEEVFANGRHTMSQDEYFYTLEIAPTILDDGGVYEAMARNSSGAISCRCSLVVDKGIRAYVAPEFCCGLEPLYQMREGEELRISAIVEAYPSVGVCWYRDGVRLRPSRRAIMTLDRDGQIELALASVTARDAGVYTCTASNEVGRVSTSGKVEILGEENSIENVQAPPIFVSDESSSALYSNEPRFLRKPRSSEAREGDTVIIECEVIGDPKPEVYWLRDFLKPDYYRDAKHFKRVGAGPEYRFEIPHAKFDYTGAYSVIAKNIHGEAKAIISLQILARDLNSSEDAHNIRYGRVEVIPRFEKELTDLLCYDGDAIEFECRVSSNPEPDIRWFHYSEVVPECPDFESSYDRGTARLKIRQVTADDEGTYRCEASNSLGRATSSACLVVYPPGEPNTLSQRLRRPPALLSGASTPRSTPRTTPRTTPARSLSATPGPDSRRLYSPAREIAPKFYTYPFNRVAEEGDTVVFQCAVKGLPPPWATWDKDGIIITASSRITMKEKDDMFRILEIEEVSVEDVGLYRITLENDYGRAEASARLEVISGKGKFHGTRSYSASPSRRALTYRRRTPSFSRQD